MGIPVYLFTGLLESGKTTLIREVAMEEDFLEPGVTLIVQCEEGEASFDEAFLRAGGMKLIRVENQEELRAEFWRRCEREFQPAQIMVEYNGMWSLDMLLQSGMPEDWHIGGIYSTVNGETAELYIRNMRKIFMEPLRGSNLIIVNRCAPDQDRQKYRRMFKAMDPQVQTAFESPAGVLYENEEQTLPYDPDDARIRLHDMDYGIWYLDAMENPQRYIGKEICFTARFCASIDPKQSYFVPGRHVMTCCEDDIAFLGFVCRFEGEMSFCHGDWVSVDTVFDYGRCDVYGPGEEGPILELVDIGEGIPPEQELVTFT